jgi:hypothetical protein
LVTVGALVDVLLGTGVRVGVFVGADVRVGVFVGMGVRVGVGPFVGTGVRVGVLVGTDVRVGVLVGMGVRVDVGTFVGAGVRVDAGADVLVSTGTDVLIGALGGGTAVGDATIGVAGAAIGDATAVSVGGASGCVGGAEGIRVDTLVAATVAVLVGLITATALIAVAVGDGAAVGWMSATGEAVAATPTGKTAAGAMLGPPPLLGSRSAASAACGLSGGNASPSPGFQGW